MLFRIPQLPKPEYRALQWVAGELDASQWEVICLGVRLAALFQQGGINPQALDAEGTRKALSGLLEAFRREPKDQEQRSHIIDPHAKVRARATNPGEKVEG